MTNALQRCRCINGFWLKMFALVTMTIDHTAATLLTWQSPYYFPMRAVGRLAFPIYCFLIVEGYFHTHNVKRYAGRLLLLTVLSEFPFSLSAGQGFPNLNYQNVFFTLFFGLAAVAVIDHSKDWAKTLTQSVPLQKVIQAVITLGVAALAWGADALHTDYGMGGIWLILLFYFFRKRPILLALSVTALLYGMFHWLEAIGALSLILIFLYNGKRGPQPFGKVGQWFFYFYYPLHLGVLVLLNIFVFHTYIYEIFGVLI